ncbi:hypothetical protein N9Q14_06080, partial [Pseudomonadales bacterium]|nr:hypothetical protein [Pseudomonadales bacterium]
PHRLHNQIGLHETSLLLNKPAYGWRSRPCCFYRTRPRPAAMNKNRRNATHRYPQVDIRPAL